jgi:uncharacterized integral membrane protein
VIRVAGNEPEHEAGAMPEGPGAQPPSPAPSSAKPADSSGTAAAGPSEPEHSLDQVAKARRRRTAKAVLALLIFVFLVLFVVANSQPVEVNFLFFTAHPRLIWVMVTCAVLGGVLGYLLGRPGSEARPKKTKTKD